MLSTLGAMAALPLLATFRTNALAAENASLKIACSLAPQMTEGPYFVEERLNRSDLTSGATSLGVVQGYPLLVGIDLVSIRGASCAPLAGVQVDVWHADATGDYSDVGTQWGRKDLRGYQVSDAGGHVRFRSIYPGWYPGRTIHIHVKARRFDAVGNKTHEFNTQLFFDETTNDAVMAMTPYNARKPRDTTNAREGIEANSRLLVATSASTSGARGLIGTITLGLDLPP
ncbi:MAG: twin-arginine translocation pathway signal protein [Betaproteobacteria bacterium]